MTYSERNILKVALMIMPIIFFSSAYFTYAYEAESLIDENSSIYVYNSLENKVNFYNIIDDDELEKRILKDNILETEDENIQKLKELIKKQISSIEKSEDTMTIIKNESGVKNFFFGNSLGTLKFQIVQMKSQDYELKDLLSQTKDYTLISDINGQIYILDKEKTRVENFILEQDGRFSLFGWIINLL